MGGEVTVAGAGVQGKLVVDRHLVPRLWRSGGHGGQPGHWLRGWIVPCNLQGGQPGLGDRLKGRTGLLATDIHPSCLLLAQTLHSRREGMVASLPGSMGLWREDRDREQLSQGLGRRVVVRGRQ